MGRPKKRIVLSSQSWNCDHSHCNNINASFVCIHISRHVYRRIPSVIGTQRWMRRSSTWGDTQVLKSQLHKDEWELSRGLREVGSLWGSEDLKKAVFILRAHTTAMLGNHSALLPPTSYSVIINWCFINNYRLLLFYSLLYVTCFLKIIKEFYLKKCL